MEKISIIGYGRFGRVLHEIFSGHFQVLTYDPLLEGSASLEDCLSQNIIFYATPISKTEEIIREHLTSLKSGPRKLIIDVQSVKALPKKFYQNEITPFADVLLTHPMFGPDSLKIHGLRGLKIMIDGELCTAEQLQYWRSLFLELGLNVLEISSEEHDQMAAESQGLIFFLTRLLQDYGFKKTSIDTVWVDKLHEIVSALGNDSWELFADLQCRNPYTKEMRVNLGNSLDRIYQKLLPERIDPERLVIGIQGGRGSFNEEAIHYYLQRNEITHYEIKYLHTTENVLKALHRGDLDLGQFAMHNSVGGIVNESVSAIANYKFKIVEEYGIKISHALITRKDSELSKINTIMTHPQVLKQCRSNLLHKYSNLKQTSGEGELIDHAKIAELLGKKELPINIATMGSKILAQLYDLKIIEDNLQDAADNFTAFLLVSR